MALLALDIGDVFQALLLIAFFLLPILRQIFGDRSKTAKPTPRRTGPRESGSSGWEDFLREQFGVELEKATPDPVEANAAEPEAPMEPSVAVSSDPSERRRRERSREEPPMVAASGNETRELGTFETGLGAIAAGQGDLAAVPSELGADLASVPSEIGELANVPSEIGQAKSGDLDDLVHSSRTAAYALDAESAASRWQTGDWRRAIVLNEILGTPVALRDGEGNLPAWR